MDSMHYTDWALGRFFEQARKEPYFKDTVFILLADHTAGSVLRGSRERHRIPLLVYAPGRIKPSRVSRTASQLDVLPTALELAGIGGEHHSFGSTLIRGAEGEGAAFLDDGGYWGWIRGERLLLADSHQARGLFRHRADPQEAHDLLASEPAVAARMQKELYSFVQVSKTLVKANRLSGPSFPRRPGSPAHSRTDPAGN
jgi:arylsulfatase A-like enzyme